MVCYSNNRFVIKQGNRKNEIRVEVRRFRTLVHIPTRQPIDGRSRDGGLRFGEMEHDPVFQNGNANYQRILH